MKLIRQQRDDLVAHDVIQSGAGRATGEVTRQKVFDLDSEDMIFAFFVHFK